MDSNKEDSGGFVGHMASPFDLSQILPVGSGSLVPCSLPGPRVIESLMRMVTVEPGQAVSPNNSR